MSLSALSNPIVQATDGKEEEGESDFSGYNRLGGYWGSTVPCYRWLSVSILKMPGFDSASKKQCHILPSVWSHYRQTAGSFGEDRTLRAVGLLKML